MTGGAGQGRLAGLTWAAAAVLAASMLVVIPAGPAAATEVGAEAQLRSAVGDPGETSVVLTADVALEDCGSGQLARDSATALTIDGDGHTITQTCPGARIFRQSGTGALTFTAVTLQGGNVGGPGGAVSSEGDVTVLGSTLRDNHSQGATGTEGGDGVGAIASAGDVTITNSTITGNTGLGGAADGAGGGGSAGRGGHGIGAISAEGVVTVTGSTLSANTGRGGRGDNATFARGGSGIGVIRGAEVHLTNSTVTHNAGTGGGSDDDGGHGIGVIQPVGNSPVTIASSVLADNRGRGGQAQGVTGIMGGGDGAGVIRAIFGAITITGSTLEGNTGRGGGGSASAGSITSGGTGVGVARFFGSLTLEDSTLRDNLGIGGAGAANNGIVSGGQGTGALHGRDVTVEIVGSTIADNTGAGGDGSVADGLGSGGGGSGAVSAAFAEVIVTLSELRGNSGMGGQGSSADGAGCCPTGGAGLGGILGTTITVVESTLRDNTGIGGDDGNTVDGSRGGAGIGGINAPFSGGGSVLLDRSTISGNVGTGGTSTSTGGDGAGALSGRVPVVSRNSTITGNTGTGDPAGVGDPTGTGGVVSTAVTTVYSTVVANSGSTVANVANQPAFDTEETFASFGSVVGLPASGPNCGQLGTVDSAGYNVADDDTCGFGAGTGDEGNTAGSLELGGLADNGGPTRTRLPAPGSVLIDLVPLDACGDGDELAGVEITGDQRGLPRPGDDACDAGAVEVQPPPPPPPPAEPDRGVVRLFGQDRTETAEAISAAMFPTADTVFLATARDFPDALAGGPLAARMGAPILLTGPDELADAARRELERLQPDTLVVLGGIAALPDPVVAQAATAAGGATVDRISGPDRYGTAAAIAARYPDAQRVYVATGLNFPDALSGAALAAARDDGPVLLIRPDSLPEPTGEQLARLEPPELVVLGGETVVPSSVAQDAAARANGASVLRLSGDDRFATGERIAEQFPAPADVVFVATGLNFPDALAGTPAAALTASPILLTRSDALPEPTVTALERLAPLQIFVLGGEQVVSAAVVAVLEDHLR